MENIVISIIDGYTTYKFHKKTDVGEGNPVLKIFIKRIGLIGAIIVSRIVFITSMIMGFLYLDGKIFFIIRVILFCMFLVCQINNINIIRKYSEK